jgi:hypothetical protein
MSDVSPDFNILSSKAPFKVLLLFHEASQARSIPSTGPSANDAMKDLVGIKVNGSMIASRMWGKVYDSKKIVIPPGRQIVGCIYRSPPKSKKAWFRCRKWPWILFACDEERELDEPSLSYQLGVDSAAESGVTLNTMIATVKGSASDDSASDAWTDLMKRYFHELQARDVTEEAPSDVSSLSEGPTTCPICGSSRTGYRDAVTQTERDPVWPNQQLNDFIDKEFGSSSQAKGQ